MTLRFFLPRSPGISVELEDVFRLACFYFSSQKQNRKKARCFCTVGSRWCESPFDFCESTYSSMCGPMGCFPSQMYTAFKQGLPERAIISHWLQSMFDDSVVKNMRRDVIYLERIEGCEIVFASVCYAFDGEAQRNSERRIGDRSPTKSATPHAALLHMDKKTTDSKIVIQIYWWKHILCENVWGLW